MLSRLIFLVLFFFYIDAASAAWCNQDSGCGGSCTSDYVGDQGYANSGLTNSLGNGAYSCPNQYIFPSGTNSTIKAKIGWSDTCATASGDNTPGQATCLTTHNLLGKVIDTFLTVGIAVAMFNQYCSFSAGDPVLEGAIVDNSFLVGCQGISPLKKRQKCMACFFQGLSYDSTNNVCSTCASESAGCQVPDVSSHLVPMPGNSFNVCDGMPNMDKPIVDSSLSYVVDNGIPVYCPMMRCNIPTNDIRTKYHDGKTDRLAIIGSLAAAAAELSAETGGISLVAGLAMTIAAAATGDCCDLNSMTDGQTEHVGFWGAMNLRVKNDGDRICSEMLMPDGYTTVACKFRVPPPVVYPPPKCTLDNTACVYGAKTHGLWAMPLTAALMECVNDIINLFFEPSEGSTLTCPTNQLFMFQANLRNIVRIMLMLYVIIFGMNLAFSGSPIKKGEIFSFIFKFALVTYFAVGTFTVKQEGGSWQFNTQEAQSVNKNGLEYLKDVAFSGMNTFASIIINAAGGDTSARPCVFDPNDPAYTDQNTNKNYGYLALWDALDCHLSFYLGLASPTAQGIDSITGGSGNFISGLKGVGVSILILPAFFGLDLFLLIFVIAFTVFLFSIVVYFTNLYIVAMLAVTVLIFFGPFFVPMVLFNYTRSMFDKWINLLFGYALQPAVISAFIALLLTTFYLIFYGGCAFSPPVEVTVSPPSWSINITTMVEPAPAPPALPTYTSTTKSISFPYWVIDLSASDASCQSSLGYIIAQLNPLVAIKRSSFAGGLFYYEGIAKDWKTIVDGMLDALMLCTFFGFLFYYFAEQLSGLAADLTGSMVLGSVVSPNAVTDLAANKLGSKLSATKDAKQDNKKGVSVNSANKRPGINVNGTSSNAAAQANVAGFKALPFAGGGEDAPTKSPRNVDAAQSNRDAFKEMPFAVDAGGPTRSERKSGKKEKRDAARAAKSSSSRPSGGTSTPKKAPRNSTSGSEST